MNLYTAPTGDQILTTVPDDLIGEVFKGWEKKTATGTTTSLVHFINLRADLGWSATTPADTYRLHPAYSNSRIGAIKSELMGRPYTGGHRVFVVGTAMHEMILEPWKMEQIEDYMLTPSEEKQVQRMVIAASRSQEIQALKYTGEVEKEFYWKDYGTKLPCKAKVDIWVEPSGTVVDLKSTSARTQEKFEAACKKYDYDRQGVFYTDGAKGRQCLFIGISKMKPYDIFFYQFRRRQRPADAARKKYRFILNKAKQLGIQP